MTKGLAKEGDEGKRIIGCSNPECFDAWNATIQQIVDWRAWMEGAI